MKLINCGSWKKYIKKRWPKAFVNKNKKGLVVKKVILIVGLPECRNKSSANQTARLFLDTMESAVLFPAEFGCPMPCTQISYRITVDYMHENSMIFPDLSVNGSSPYEFYIYFR